MRYVTTNVRLDADDYRELRQEAQALGISLAEALRRAVHSHVVRGSLAPGQARGVYGASAAAAPPVEEALCLATVRGGYLSAPAPAELAEGQPVLVHILGPLTDADLAALRRQRASLQALGHEMEVPRPGGPREMPPHAPP